MNTDTAQNETLPSVPLVAYEAAQARNRRTLAYIIAGWTVSTAVLAAALLYVIL